jgi:hypothetical protein
VDVRVVVLLTALAAGLTVASGDAQAPPPQAVFHTGATAGIIRDATKVGATIYAVGTWVNPATGKTDGSLWTFEGANAPTRTAMPDIGGSGSGSDTDTDTHTVTVFQYASSRLFMQGFIPVTGGNSSGSGRF